MTTREEVIAALADPADRHPRETAAKWLEMTPRSMSNWATDEAGNILSRDVLDRTLAALWRRETAERLAFEAKYTAYKERCPKGGRPPRRSGWAIDIGLVHQLAEERCATECA